MRQHEAGLPPPQDTTIAIPSGKIVTSDAGFNLPCPICPAAARLQRHRQPGRPAGTCIARPLAQQRGREPQRSDRGGRRTRQGDRLAALVDAAADQPRRAIGSDFGDRGLAETGRQTVGDEPRRDDRHRNPVCPQPVPQQHAVGQQILSACAAQGMPANGADQHDMPASALLQLLGEGVEGGHHGGPCRARHPPPTRYAGASRSEACAGPARTGPSPASLSASVSIASTMAPRRRQSSAALASPSAASPTRHNLTPGAA